MPNPSSSRRGWHYNAACDVLEARYNDTVIFNLDGSGLGGVTWDAGSVTAAAIADNSLNGDQVANVATSNTEGGIPLTYQIAIGNCAVNVSVVDKIQVIDAWIVVTAADATETVTLDNGTACCAISSAMSVACACGTVVRTTTLTNMTVDPACCQTLTMRPSAGTDTATGCLFVTAIKVA